MSFLFSRFLPKLLLGDWSVVVLVYCSLSQSIFDPIHLPIVPELKHFYRRVQAIVQLSFNLCILLFPRGALPTIFPSIALAKSSSSFTLSFVYLLFSYFSRFWPKLLLGNSSAVVVALQDFESRLYVHSFIPQILTFQILSLIHISEPTRPY